MLSSHLLVSCFNIYFGRCESSFSASVFSAFWLVDFEAFNYFHNGSWNSFASFKELPSEVFRMSKYPRKYSSDWNPHPELNFKLYGQFSVPNDSLEHTFYKIWRYIVFRACSFEVNHTYCCLIFTNFGKSSFSCRQTAIAICWVSECLMFNYIYTGCQIQNCINAFRSSSWNGTCWWQEWYLWIFQRDISRHLEGPSSKQFFFADF